jgi:hypothetical protein
MRDLGFAGRAKVAKVARFYWTYDNRPNFAADGHHVTDASRK